MAKHLALPLTLTGGDFAALDQDSPAEIAQSLTVLLRTEPGERAAVPDYGLPSPVGTGADPEHLADVIAAWEERADPAAIEAALATLTEQRATIYPEGA